MPSHSRVVVIGGGIIGISVAYHLMRLGAQSITVIEREAVAQGSTGLSSGGVRTQFGTREETLLSLRSLQLWEEIEGELGVDFGFNRVGYCVLLSTEDQVAAFRAREVYQRELGVSVETLTEERLQQLAPGIVTTDIKLATFTAMDGYAAPADVTLMLAAAARERGVSIRQGTRVISVEVSGGRVTGVNTTDGPLACDVVVNAAGVDSPEIGRMVGMDIPVVPFRQHQFITEPLDWMKNPVPCIQDMALDLYIRPEGKGLLFGVAEELQKAVSRSATVNWDLAVNLAEKIEHRWPRLESASIRNAWVGCYEVTPDHKPFIGQACDPAGFIYATGFSGHGFMHGFAAGEVVAELVLYGASRTLSLEPFRLERVPELVEGR